MSPKTSSLLYSRGFALENRAKEIRRLLDKWIPHPKIPLDFTDPFTLLIATVLSAQCTDDRVNRTTPALFAEAPTPKAMAALDVHRIESIIRPCGLFKVKAKAIRRLSEELIERFGSKVPSSIKDLESLPGVGHKTASILLIYAFGQPAFPVDTHIFRCAKRWGLSSKTTVEGVEKDLKKIFPEESWARVHLQMVLFGRKYCPARGHQKEACPICARLSPIDPFVSRQRRDARSKSSSKRTRIGSKRRTMHEPPKEK